jgi:hypothetical protein
MAYHSAGKPVPLLGAIQLITHIPSAHPLSRFWRPLRGPLHALVSCFLVYAFLANPNLSLTPPLARRQTTLVLVNA